VAVSVNSAAAQNITLTKVGSNYTGTLANLPTTQALSIRVKGPAHLGKIFSVPSLTAGSNSIDWTSTPLIPGDIDNDNFVDLSDYSQLVTQFDPISPKSIYTKADLNFDTFVDLSDYSLLVANFDPTTPGQ
jgi:hypothetical protein